MNPAGGLLYNLGPQDELLRNLECPICTDVPIPPIFSCQNGHMICSACKIKLQNCGLCAAKFLDIRNYPLEAIVNSSSFRCPFEEDGCKERIKGNVYKNHLDACDFRNVLCSHTSTKKCDHQLIPYRNFLRHLELDHKYKKRNILSDGMSVCVSVAHATTIRDNYWPILCMESPDGNFFQRSIIKKEVYYVLIKYFGTEDVAKKFMAKIKIFNSNKEMEVEWKTPVHAFRKTDEEVIRSGLCASIQKAQLTAIANLSASGQLEWKTKFIIFKV